MKIRKAAKNDLKGISDIFRNEYSKPPYNENWSEKMSDERIGDDLKFHDMYVADIDGKLVGFITLSSYLWHIGLRGMILEIAIDSKYQNKGYGKALMSFAEKYFKDKGAKEIQLVSSPNSLAYQIYKKLNYIDEGYITMYKKI